MTAEELIAMALSLKGESADMADDYRGWSLAALNILLAETLPLENQLRFAKGEKELDTAPQLTAFTDPIPYDAGLVRTGLVYGMAARLTADDHDTPRFNYLNSMYAQAFLTGTPGVCEPICDTVWRDA